MNLDNNVKSVYIHIPFCESICSYCDFCKFYYNREWVNKYLISLKKEIELNYKGESLDTIYVGGGTPSCLDVSELKELFNIIKVFKLRECCEFTFECNIENIDEKKLKLLYENGVNRLSIGVQTFNEKLKEKLNRKHTNEEVFNKINLMHQIGFDNINVDLIYAIPGETLEDLDNDLSQFLKLGINHISTYSLIIEPNTKLYIDNVLNIDEDIDYLMYKKIIEVLNKNNFIHYETSNFSKKSFESKHNLTYWNNLEYYGFGIGASGYIKNIRYDNTKSFNKYISGIYIKETHELSIIETIENEFILGLRKINGINKEIFKNKYDIDIEKIKNVLKLVKEGKLIDDGINIYIADKYIYLANEVLIDFIGLNDE